MESYNGCSDEELILRLRDGESGVMDYIMEKYKGLVRSKAKSMYLLGADSEDLIQEGMIGLFKAVQDYDAGRDASFFTFADLCVSRQMYTAVQASTRKKHAPLNRYVSLSRGGSPADGEESVPYEPEQVWEKSPEELVIDRENEAFLEQTIERELSALEKQVLDLHLTGMGYVQIARVLGRDAKSTDNALQRLRAKLRRALEEKKHAGQDG
ncbi:MAG: sigma-70 family RNA polymerase sigma factor [Eubacteriales bacterium]|nr:sigma-70 family RNA polymerase sigma factor [Eubacteriales bacterium]